MNNAQELFNFVKAEPEDGVTLDQEALDKMEKKNKKAQYQVCVKHVSSLKEFFKPMLSILAQKLTDEYHALKRRRRTSRGRKTRRERQTWSMQ